MDAYQIENSILENFNTNYLFRLIRTLQSNKLLLKVLTLSLSVVIIFYRRPDCFLHPQFWAEDGTVFFQQNILFGLKSFIIPYQGYLLFIPRTVAFLYSIFPYAITPALYNFSALIIFLLVSTRFFNQRVTIRYKGLLALSLAIVPIAGEVYMNIANIQWITAPLLVLIPLMSPPKTIWQAFLDYFIIFMVGLTGPFIIVAAPLFFLKLFLHKSKHNFVLLSLAILTAGTQLYFIETTFVLGHSIYLISMLQLKIVGYRFFGSMFLGSHYAFFHPIFLSLMTIVLIMVLVWTVAKDKNKLYSLSICLYFGLTLLFVGMQKSDQHFLLTSLIYGDRYFFLPHLMFLWGLIICLDTSNSFKKGIIIVLLGATIYSSYTQINLFPPLPFINYHWKHYVKELKDNPNLKIPINPPGWVVDLKTIN